MKLPISIDFTEAEIDARRIFYSCQFIKPNLQFIALQLALRYP